MQALGTQIAQIGCDLDGPAEEGESGYGPLRAWPGGLCVSRAIGDIDVGDCILAYPHIVQLEVPSDGVRLALASDGVSCCACQIVEQTLTGQTGRPAGVQLHGTEPKIPDLGHCLYQVWH